MTEPMMSSDRFHLLAQAYGGAIDRWPAADQASARARLALEPTLAQALGEAAALDAFLDAAPQPTFSGVLREQLIAGARNSRPRAGPVVRWLSGAGLAAACLIGVVTGAHFSDSLIGTTTSNTSASASDTVGQTSTAFDSQSDVLSFGEIG